MQEQIQGLLGAGGPATPMPSAGAGLLGAGPQMPQDGQGDEQGQIADIMQMAQALAAQPSMEVAQQIVQQLQRSGNPGAQEFAQMVQQTGGQPAQLQQLAQQMLNAENEGD